MIPCNYCGARNHVATQRSYDKIIAPCLLLRSMNLYLALVRRTTFGLRLHVVRLTKARYKLLYLVMKFLKKVIIEKVCLHVACHVLECLLIIDTHSMMGI